jgi:hypothetical protein
MGKSLDEAREAQKKKRGGGIAKDWFPIESLYDAMEKDFDPFDLDITPIQELLSGIPAGGDIPYPVADKLRVKLWAMACRLTDVINFADRYRINKAAEADERHAEVLRESVASSATAQRQEADTDERYLGLKKDGEQAKRFVNLLKAKQDDLMSGHTLCKAICKEACEMQRRQDNDAPTSDDF